MICALIPTYNNASTVGDIIRRTAAHLPDIIVVNDGSTDHTPDILLRAKQDIPTLTIINLPHNSGKGKALAVGMRHGLSHGFTHMLTIDADGQHYPEDIPAMLRVSKEHPEAFIIGSRNIEHENMQRQSTFANKFSNFWFTVQTGIRLPDTQTGMRIYPLQHLHGLRLLTSRYESELELLVFAAWANETIIPVPIRVYYPPKEQRVSHFRPAYDFTRISILNTILCFAAILYGWPRILIGKLIKSIRGAKKHTLCLLFLSLFTFHLSPLCAKPHLPAPVEGNKRLYAYPAATEQNTGVAMIVCPGGSYSWLDMATEGIGVAEWLQAQGINAFVLRYRVANVSAYMFGYRVLGIGNKYPNMLIDVQDALRYVYEHAAEYAIDTARIGVIGFSAGGHLTMSSYLYNNTPYKPHFLCPIYPVVSMSDPVSHKRSRRGALGVWRQWDSTMRDSLSLEKHIQPTTPPVFLVNCKDDPIVHYHNSELLDSALTAQHIPHTYIQYLTGKHGFGATPEKTTAEAIQWKQAFTLWIQQLFNL